MRYTWTDLCAQAAVRLAPGLCLMWGLLGIGLGIASDVPTQPHDPRGAWVLACLVVTVVLGLVGLEDAWRHTPAGRRPAGRRTR